MIDLATDGVRSLRTRGEVVTAVRRVMFSAQRAGWTWSEVHALLTDTGRRRLAKQLSTGRGDRPIGLGAITKFLQKHWDEISATALAAPAWDRTDALHFLDLVQDELDTADLPALDRQLLQLVLDLGRRHGTTRPAVPVRVVQEHLGISRSGAHRALMRLSAQGHWLDLAKRGDRTRANLYRVAPALRVTPTATTPPHTAAEQKGPDMTGSSLTFHLDEDDHAAVLALLAQRQLDKSRPDTGTGNVVEFDRAAAQRRR